MKNNVNSDLKTKEEISISELSQGKYIVIYPDEMELDEIASIKEKVFKLLERHSCTVKKLHINYKNETG
jgi:hypothetical protein